MDKKNNKLNLVMLTLAICSFFVQKTNCMDKKSGNVSELRKKFENIGKNNGIVQVPQGQNVMQAPKNKPLCITVSKKRDIECEMCPKEEFEKTGKKSAPKKNKPERPNNKKRVFLFVGKNKIKNKWSQLDCPICITNFTQDDENLIKLPCGHIFHKECVAEWIGADIETIKQIVEQYFLKGSQIDLPYEHLKNLTCPNCRQDIIVGMAEECLGFFGDLIKNRNLDFKKAIFYSIEHGLMGPLHACMCERCPSELANMRDFYWMTTLYRAADYSNINPQKSFEMIKFLVGKGFQYYTGAYKLEIKDLGALAAIRNRNSEAYKYLSDKIENLFLEEFTVDQKHGNKLLMESRLSDAIKFGFTKVVRKFIDYKIDIVDYKYDESINDSALHKAAYYSDENYQKGFEIIKLLVENLNSDINAISNDNILPIDLIKDRASEAYKYLARKMGLPEGPEERPRANPYLYFNPRRGLNGVRYQY